ncbi:MAG: Bug family tripartite tricarboxylate transporter substrate binding protein [Clostridia bacterium]
MKKSGPLLAFALALAFAAGGALAQGFTKPLKIVVPFPPGGSADTSSRILAEHMSKRLGQPVVIENRPGGGTVIGTQLVQRAAPDGTSLLVVFPSFVVNPAIREHSPYQLKDFRAVGQTIALPMVFAVNPAVPAKTLKELIDLARSKPGSIAYGTPGPASTHRIIAEMFRLAAGLSSEMLVHVAFQGGAPAVTATIGGHTPMVVVNVNEVAQHVKAGKLRALVVTTRERAQSLPEVPTYAESGFPQLEASNWSGMVVPAATPAPLVAQLNAALVAALGEPDVLEKFKAQELIAVPGTAAEFDAFLQAEAARYAKVIREAGIKAE